MDSCNQLEINKFKKYFTILKDWKIVYNISTEYTGRCYGVAKTKQAEIYPYSSTDEKQPLDYIFHEIVHICIKEITYGTNKEKREKEELFIQDLCSFFNKNLNL